MGSLADMSSTITLALDAMGGDDGPAIVLPGAQIALERRSDLNFIIYGEAPVVEPILAKHSRVQEASTFVHCDVSVQMDDKPSQALRRGRWKSSMWRCIQAVRDGDAQAAVSAGNTGALMAMSKFCLKTLPGIERPAIAAIWPTLRGESIVLDVGATIGADAQTLVDFAVMGAAMARSLFGLERPSVGLLNIGVEEIKGVEDVREAGRILRAIDHPHFHYHGFVEGGDLGKGTVDVVVTEGFSGNIALKTAEGTARQISEYLRTAMDRTIFSRIGYLLAQSAFNRLREKMDPGKGNGGVFLGLNGVVIKSHGGTDADGFAAAIEVAREMARDNLVRLIADDMELGRQDLEPGAVVPAEAATG
jgi:glycerol-3-phosphate acyltransferase PlsX